MDDSEPQEKAQSQKPLIAIVGPCAAGKTTLAEGLAQYGYQARQIAQEHSYVPQMWQLLTKPDILIYVDAGFESCTERKQLNWSPEDYERQIKRLTHARQHCDIYIDTEGISAEGALKRALEALEALP